MKIIALIKMIYKFAPDTRVIECVNSLPSAMLPILAKWIPTQPSNTHKNAGKIDYCSCLQAGNQITC